MTLRRIDTARGHHYKLDGKPVPGVTTIISKGVPKPALSRWAAKSAAEYVADNLDTLTRLPDRESIVAVVKQAPWTKRDRAAVRGTEVHRYAEELVHGRDVIVPEHLGGYVDACARFLDDFAVTPVLTEFTVASRQWWYAGTADLICDMDGRRVILDWKSSSGIYAETALQLAAYRFAEFYLADDGTETALPEVEDTGYGVRLADTGLYYAHPLPITDWTFKRFLYAAQIAGWQDASKEIVGDPVSPQGSDAA